MSGASASSPPALAAILAFEVKNTPFAVTVAVALLFAPADVTLEEGAIVAAPLADQVTVRP